MNSALSVYETGLRHGKVQLVTMSGMRWQLPFSRWINDHQRADERMLAQCAGSTLDVGCGPGRLTAALTERGTTALGIDISPLAVEMTISRGGIALQRNVFDELPGHGRWDHLLLADGNIGIGGNPVRLLKRCRELLAPHGTVILDVEPPGTGLLIEQVRLENTGQSSEYFRWCWLSVDELPRVADAAGLRVLDCWTADDRWQALLRPAW